DRQQEILSSVGLNHTLIDRKLLIQLKKPLSLIEKRSVLSLSKSDRFEPREFGQDKEKNRAFDPAFLIGSGLVNKVRTEIRKSLMAANSNPAESVFPNSLFQLQYSKLTKSG
ncbi:MAG: hypothetical protein JRJ69_12660, partial [Deltaproteobacteria bacterium]|nr:hypothetical protein [Deltaproteobacteria bacterium]